MEHFPKWMKSTYGHLIHHARSHLAHTKVLDWLDEKAKSNRHFHYVRSLLALHHIPDLIQLDIPWWTYSSIQAFEKHIAAQTRPISVFEWGMGASTIWLAKRCDEVISIEHDPKWYEIMKPFLADYPNVSAHLIEPDPLLVDEKYTSAVIPQANFKAYVIAIEQTSKRYRYIVIDGRAREACLWAALPHLSEGGIILFDNSDRVRYQKALQNADVDITRYRGRVPCSPLSSETSIMSIAKRSLNQHK